MVCIAFLDQAENVEWPPIFGPICRLS